MYQYTDLYESLGITKNAKSNEIKSAYRSLALKYHPDKNPGNTEAEERFKKIAYAYDILEDPIKKRDYDRYSEFGFVKIELPSAKTKEQELAERKQRAKNILRLKKEKWQREILLSYGNSLTILKPIHRYILYALGIFTSFKLIFDNTYLNEDDVNVLLSTLGFTIMLFSHLFLYNFLFKKWLAISIIKGNRQQTEAKIGPHFIFTISILICLFLFSSFQYKSFILERYGVETEATILGTGSGRIVFGFTTEKGEYVKKIYNLEIYNQFHPAVLDKLLIKYASVNPRVCKVISPIPYIAEIRINIPKGKITPEVACR